MFVRRVLVGSAALGLAVLGAVPAASAKTTTTAPAPAAATWLATQLVDGNHLETSFEGTAYPDAGLTADAVLAFDAAKVEQDAAARATTWLATPDVLTGYIGNGGTESYAGAHAKLALVAEAQGVDPAAFGGRDLLAELRALQAKTGRFRDKSQYGDFSSGISQALAILALHRAGAGTTLATAARATAQATPALAGVGLADVSATGAVPTGPQLACAAPTPTPTPTATATPTVVRPTPTHTSTRAAPAGAAGGSPLPATGTPTGALTGAAVLLL